LREVVFQRLRQLFAPGAVALEVPLAAHGVALARAAFRIKQHPTAATCRACTLAGIVLGQSPLDIVSPADISQVAIVRERAENIDVAVHASSIWCRVETVYRKLLNEPTGTTGCAPVSKPLLLA